MKKAFQSSRDVIIQTDNWAKAIEFYETAMGFTVSHRSSNLMGFETGAFCLYVEKGNRPGPVFDFLVPNMQAAKRRLLAAGCTVVEENPAIPRRYIRDPFGLVLTSKKKAILLKWI
jgi:predicted enzyme related to lactoylglutathione lyase